MNFNPPPSTTTLAAGSWLDRYELLAPIAEGGFGQVWLARLRGKRGFEKLVAIKVPRISADVHFQEMLLDEARIAAAIEHDNVARILELGEQGDLLYIVMEWVDGEPLSTLVRTLDKKRVALPIALSLRIISDMCAAVHAAHELRGPDGVLRGVVHRDISPQNMLISTTGTIKLIDFGIAKARDRASGETTDGTLKGKIKYMSPEQALGGMIDRRADIFGLGAVLNRLLSGRAPYEGDNEVATLHRLSGGGPPNALPDSVPGEVRAIVSKALALAPGGRYATALEMQEALGRTMLSLKMVVAPSDIARFADEHLRERIEARRSAVDIALKAAADRAASNNAARLLAAPAAISSADSLGGPASASGLSSNSGLSSESGPSVNSYNSNSNSNSNSHSSSASGSSAGSASSSLESGRMFALDVGVPSGHGDPAQGPASRPSSASSKKLRWLWGVALAIGVLGVALILVTAVRHQQQATPTLAATAPPPASTPEPTPTTMVEATPSASAAASTAPSASVAIASPPPTSPAPAPTQTQRVVVRPPPRVPPFTPQKPKQPGAKPAASTDFGY